MSAREPNPMFVGWWPISGSEPAYWQCRECEAEGEEHTIAKAADAGRGHLLTVHFAPIQDQLNNARARLDAVLAAGGSIYNPRYSPACGVRTDDCGRAVCGCQERTDGAVSEAEGEKASVDPGGENGPHSPAQPFIDFEQAINRAHNHSREGA